MNKFDELYYNIICENISEFNGITLAVVPGSFRPPHRGHWEMIQKYAEVADKVLIIISNISKYSIMIRPLSKGNLSGFLSICKKMEKINDSSALFEIINKNFGDKQENVTFEVMSKTISDICSQIDQMNNESLNIFKELLLTYLEKLKINVFSSIRTTKNGNEITPDIAKRIFQIYASAYGLQDKVIIKVSTAPSPMLGALDVINDECSNCKIILGVSEKDGDDSRWKSFLKNITNETCEIIEQPAKVDTMLSATDIRENIDNLDRSWFPDKLSEQDYNEIMEMLK